MTRNDSAFKYAATQAVGCCGDSHWRGRFCPYHQGVEDGYDAAIESVLKSTAADVASRRRLEPPTITDDDWTPPTEATPGDTTPTPDNTSNPTITAITVGAQVVYSVHDEPDYERTYDEDEQITIRKGDLRAVLDVATMSMDFGSGFLDNEQVEALRKLAAIIGLDPIIATPFNFVCQYRNRHTWKFYPKGYDNNYHKQDTWFCDVCHHYTYEDPLSAEQPPLLV